MEPYGAQRLQPVAIGGKWDGPQNGSDTRKPLRRVATSCLRRSMVRRGSTVRVRQRALQKPRKSRPFLSAWLAQAPVCDRYGAVDERQRDAAIAVHEPLADEREVRDAIGKSDDLTVEDALRRQVGKLGEQRCHVPPAAGANAEVAVARYQRPEAIPLQFKRVIACGKPSQCACTDRPSPRWRDGRLRPASQTVSAQTPRIERDDPAVAGR
jgi:hypothetical protein